MTPLEPMKRPPKHRSPFANWHVACRAFALVWLVLSVGCGKPTQADRVVPPDRITNFSILFQQNCAGCHGATGLLGPAPPLNDPLFQQMVSDQQLLDIVSNGREDTLMPVFAAEHGGPLASEQIKIVVQGVRQWRSGSDAEDLPPFSATAEDLAAADPQQGAQLFKQICARCHGEQGEGGTAGALNDSAFLALSSNHLIRRIIITGRPDLGMPNFRQLGEGSPLAKPLDAEQINDLVAFIRTWESANGRPVAKEPGDPADATGVPSS